MGTFALDRGRRRPAAPLRHRVAGDEEIDSRRASRKGAWGSTVSQEAGLPSGDIGVEGVHEEGAALIICLRCRAPPLRRETPQPAPTQHTRYAAQHTVHDGGTQVRHGTKQQQTTTHKLPHHRACHFPRHQPFHSSIFDHHSPVPSFLFLVSSPPTRLHPPDDPEAPSHRRRRPRLPPSPMAIIGRVAQWQGV